MKTLSFMAKCTTTIKRIGIICTPGKIKPRNNSQQGAGLLSPLCELLLFLLSFIPTKMANQLESVFTKTLDEIKNKLKDKAEKNYKNQLEKLQKTLKTAPRQRKIKAIEEKQKELEEKDEEIKRIRESIQQKKETYRSQIKTLENEMRDLDPVHKHDSEEFMEKHPCMNWNWNYRLNFPTSSSIRETEYKALVMLEKSKEFRNYANYKKIEEKYRAMRELTSTPRQRQELIIGLQNKIDRHALGIDIPTLLEIQEIEVVNGEIVLNNALPAPAGE